MHSLNQLETVMTGYLLPIHQLTSKFHHCSTKSLASSAQNHKGYSKTVVMS